MKLSVKDNLKCEVNDRMWIVLVWIYCDNIYFSNSLMMLLEIDLDSCENGDSRGRVFNKIHSRESTYHS